MSIPAKYLHAAGCLLAQVAGEELSRQELDEVAWAGYRRGDGAKVAEALRGILRNGAAYDAGYRGKAWLALARGKEAGDLPLMRRGLREELARDMGVAWQIMRGLEMMGERVIREDRGGGALWEEEDNREDAERYLERVAGE